MQGQKRDANKLGEVAERLHAAAIHLLRRVRKQDITMAQGPARISALSVLVFGGPMTLGKLAATEQVKPPTMSRIVSGLERSGFVQRVRDAKDARRADLRATPKGMKLMQRGRRRRIKYLANHLDGLSRYEISVMEQALEMLETVLRDWK